MADRFLNRLFGDIEIIPVVMFHSVGLEDSDWVFKHISEPLANFEEKIARLAQANYNFIFWSDLYDYMTGSRKITLPAVMLTFDDGYLDNWVYAYPILKKYGAKATIFVTPEFVDPSTKPRPNLDDVSSGIVPENQLQVAGFLNWEEMRIMEKSALVDIQSHGLTHTWYFSSPRLIDFHKPGGKKYPWMAWNLRADRKPFYMTEDQSHFIPLGTPIYEHDKGLLCKRYFPPDQVAAELTTLVEKNGGTKFFLSAHWADSLRQYHTDLMNIYKNKASSENPAEYAARVFHELQHSKRLIEENLTKEVQYICWPGGAYNREVLSLAVKAGYKAWTLTSTHHPSHRNIQGADPTVIRRIGSAPFQKYKKKILSYTSGSQFLCAVKRHQASSLYKYLGWCKKLKLLIHPNKTL